MCVCVHVCVGWARVWHKNKHTRKKRRSLTDKWNKRYAAGWTGVIHNLLSSADVTTGNKWSTEHKRALFITGGKIKKCSPREGGYSSTTLIRYCTQTGRRYRCCCQTGKKIPLPRLWWFSGFYLTLGGIMWPWTGGSFPTWELVLD